MGNWAHDPTYLGVRTPLATSRGPPCGQNVTIDEF